MNSNEYYYLLQEVLNYLNFNSDDLCGDDLIGDGRKTHRFQEIVEKIESMLKDIKK